MTKSCVRQKISVFLLVNKPVTNYKNTDSLLPVYNRCDIVMQRGEGVYLFDDSGKQYLDFASGIAVNSLGHCHPHLVETLQKQVATLWHCSNLYQTEGLNRFAERLTAASFADKVFMTNSGAEAVEAGIKIIRKYHSSKGTPRPDIITVSGAFHGRTFACISAGMNKRAVEGFEPLLPGFTQVAFGDISAMQAAITPQTGGILLEPIQGEGGICVQDKQYMQEVRKLADDNGLLLFLDEVQSGIGRTGKFFAFEHFGITPDICSIAKGIGSGFPMGACMAKDDAASGMGLGSHGGTYGGNPLASCVGNAVLDIILADGFLQNVTKNAELLKGELQKLGDEFPQIIKEIRGIGLMLGIKTFVPAKEIMQKLQANGLLAVASSHDNVIRLLPPLIIDSGHIKDAINIIRKTIKA